MNERAPFQASDLEELDARLYSRADRVVPMRDIWKGDIGRNVIGLRHDVDAASDAAAEAFETALAMARWECDHGYSSTYFLLHGAPYWTTGNLARAMEFEELGHEVGLHVNGIAEAFRQKRDPAVIVAEALAELREFVRVEGCVAHGDPLCRDSTGRVRFVNDEMFLETQRPDVGDPCRIVTHGRVAVPIAPVSRADMGLGYDANWLPKGNYLSDSGGRWSQRLDDVAEAFGSGQLHVLTHPDWLADAFVGVPV